MNRAISPVNRGKAKVALDGDTALTLAQKGRGNPFDPANYGEIVKPGELVDIVELSPLTLADRRIYNLLIANAWDRIGEPVVVLVEATDGLVAEGRAEHQGPEDGTTLVRLPPDLRERIEVGSLLRARVVATEGVDLQAVEVSVVRL